MERISVAMAVYNGEKYIKDQVDSILKQLRENDELIISYNESNDKTWKILQNYRHNRKVKIYICKEKGVTSNFSNAIRKSKGDYIFLSDQDDVWEDNKVETVMKAFKKANCDLVLHNAKYTDSKLNDTGLTLFSKRGEKTGVIHTILKNCFQGCCMAFKKDVKQYIFPIPKSVPMHDQWIGILASTFGKIEIVNDCLIKYRVHETNTSQDGLPVLQKITTRLFLLYQYLIRLFSLIIK